MVVDAGAFPPSFCAQSQNPVSIRAEIELEKKIKNRGRQWKINLIEKENPSWRDLSNDFVDSATARRMTGRGTP